MPAIKSNSQRADKMQHDSWQQRGPLSSRALLGNGITQSWLIKDVLRRGKETRLSQLSLGLGLFLASLCRTQHP